jgi:MFS family permease
MTIFGFSPILAAKLHVPNTDLIWLNCAFFIPHTAASIWLVFQKINNHERIMGISFFGLALSLVFVPFSSGLASLSLLHGVIGLALGVIFPLLLSKVVVLSSPALKMSMMGFYQSFYALGIFFGPLVAGSIADFLGLSYVFWFSCCLSLTAGAIAFRFTNVSKDN